MGRRGPAVTLLMLGIAFLALQSFSEAAAVSPQLPSHMLMTAIVVVKQEPLNLDHLSVSWEHNGRLLVDFDNHHVTSYEPRALMPREHFQDGNFSLILTNITTSDTGSYTCRVHYQERLQIIQYDLRVQKHRIQLIDLSPKGPDNTAQTNERSGSRQFLSIGGFTHVTSRPGQNISLMCKFHTDSSMELTMLNIWWSKDGGTLMTFNKDVQEEQLSRGNANLNLFSVQSRDSGKYTCNIRYRKLERNFSTNLIVRDEKEDSVLRLSTISTDDKFRKGKVAAVVGVVVVVNCFAFFLYFCLAG